MHRMEPRTAEQTERQNLYWEYVRIKMVQDGHLTEEECASLANHDIRLHAPSGYNPAKGLDEWISNRRKLKARGNFHTEGSI